ncbi:hypothetical protein D3C87_2042910 [compost metagenome]
MDLGDLVHHAHRLGDPPQLPGGIEMGEETAQIAEAGQVAYGQRQELHLSHHGLLHSRPSLRRHKEGSDGDA